MKRNPSTTALFPTDAGYHEEILLATNTPLSISTPSATFNRQGGCFEAVAYADFTFPSPGPELSMYLEGSFDGVAWTILASTAIGGITSAGQAILNSTTNSVVALGRYSTLRLRVQQDDGGAAWTGIASAGVTSIGRAESPDYRTFALSFANRSTALGSRLTRRLPGTRICNVEVAIPTPVGSGTVVVALWGSPDDGSVAVGPIATATITSPAGGSAFLQQNGSNDIDLGGFNNFQIITTPTGGTSAYAATVYYGADADWLIPVAGETGGALPPSVDDILLRVIPTSDSPQAAPGPITVRVQVSKFDGTPFTNVTPIVLSLSDLTGSGQVDLAANAVFGAATIGNILAGSATNQVAVATNASGQIEIAVTDAVAETVHIYGDTSGVPSGVVPSLVAYKPQIALTFS